MPITVTAKPTALTWADFKISPSKILDPNDGTLTDAVTGFKFALPDLPPRTIASQFAMGDPNVLTIIPDAQVFSGVVQNAALLSHEQFHYDVGIVTARALARKLTALRAPSLIALRTAVQDAARLHLTIRAQLIQKRYDIETQHGTNAHYQKIWKDGMASCLANARSDHLGGFWL